MDREGNLDHCGNSFNPLPFEQRRGGRGGGREGGGDLCSTHEISKKRFDIPPPPTPSIYTTTHTHTYIMLNSHSFTHSFLH